MAQRNTMAEYPSSDILRNIACEYGTPAMIYDEDGIRNRIRKYIEGFRSSRFRTKVLYASKVFLCRQMADIAREEGMHFDAVSGGEIFCLKNAGIPAEKIYFHGNNKSAFEIREFFRMGCGHIIVDNEDELMLVQKIADEEQCEMNILFRINPGVEAHTHQYIATASKDSKFGISSDHEDIILRLMNMLDNCRWLHFSGFHSHIGSQIFEIEAYEKTIALMFDFMSGIAELTGKHIDEYDLGGGFAIKYTDADAPPDTITICKRILAACEKESERTGLDVDTIIIEPGRSIVGDLGHTLYTAGCRKKTETVEYIFADGGMADNIRPALYEAEYSCTNISRQNQPAAKHYTIAGKCCESGDIIIRDAFLPETFPGDLLLVHSTGAYGYSMASCYNRLGRPPVIFIRQGQPRLVIKRENYEDMMHLEIQ